MRSQANFNESWFPRTGLLDREERLSVIAQVAQMNSYPLGTHLLLAKVLLGFSFPEESARKPQDGNPVFVTASLSSGFSHPDWRKFEGAIPELDRINEAAQWDYQ
jgi:hypothetical protein